MYSRKVVEERLNLFAREYAWMPVYHSLEEVEKFKEMMKTVVTFDSNTKSTWVKSIAPMTEKRMAEIKRWIENEMVLCTLDSNYWETRYAYVCDEKGQIFKYQPRLSQQILDSVIAEFDEKQVSIELLILKGRQLGVTSWTAMKFIRRMLFFPHTQAIMASVKSEASQLIGRILDTAYERCPYWLVPLRAPRKSFSNGSILSVQSGMQATGLAQGWTPTCLVPNTLIRTADGFFKQISSIKSSDSILTHTGRIAKVKKAFKTRPEGDITRKLKIWGNHSPLECTSDHLILTPDGWVEASELSVGDYVSHPVITLGDSLGHIYFSRYGRGKISPERKKKFSLPANYDFGYLCGLYLAEGSVHKSGIGTKKIPYYSEVIFTVHEREAEARVESLRNVLGQKQHINVKPHNKNGAQIRISSAWLARFLAGEFGERLKKHIPEWAYEGSHEFCWGIVRGYMDGDGHCDKSSNNVVAPTICQQVAYQMRDLIASLHLGWSSIYFVPKHIENGMHKRDTWRLVLSGPVGAAYRRKCDMPFRKPLKPRHWRYGSNFETIEVMVESVSDGWSDSFWDIEVDHEDHSFTTEQCSVHNCVHISELADIPDAKKVIEEGLLRATHSSKNLFLVLEGTGGGNTGWLADTWRTRKEGWPKGQSRLCPIFIPWPMCPEIYPEQDWIRKFPIENSWKPNEITRKHVIRCESYIRNTPYLAKVAGRDWRMPIEQQWFWEFNYLEACGNHSQKTWLAQMPADDYEALTGVHDTVFDPEVMDDIENQVYELVTDRATGIEVKERRVPLQAYAIRGHSIDESFLPDESLIDRRKPTIDVVWKSHRGERYDWELIPLVYINEEIEKDTFDKLLVYEPPQSGVDYACGVDTADGLDKEDEERACASISKVGRGTNYDLQAAEITSKRMNPAQMVPFVACIATWYGKNTKDWRGVKFAIEQIRGPGDTCQNQLKIMGFNYHHIPRRYDSKKVKDDSRHKEGWFSTNWSVPILMTRYVEAVNGGWYVPQSKWLIEELKTLERHITGSKSKMEHRSGQFDDRVRAAAQSFFTTHDLDDLAARAQKRYALPNKTRDPDAGKCRINNVSVGDW